MRIERTIKSWLVGALLLPGCQSARAVNPPQGGEAPAPKLVEGAAQWDFDKLELGKPPPGWKTAYTNPAPGKAEWMVVHDPVAPTRPHVFRLAKTESGVNTFNLALVENGSFRDVDLSVKIQPNSGVKDQGGGLVWRVKDEKNYLLCRINPVESNIRVYRVENGERTQLQTATLVTKAGFWYTLRVVMSGDRITCYINTVEFITAREGTMKDAGTVGFWTQGDAATSFDNFSVQEVKSEATTPAGKG
jgi:hypothetical protein